MPDIHIRRQHALGLPAARKLAFRWAELAEERFDMECTYEEGKTADLVSFTRSGVNGELKVTRDLFELDARLGFLLGAFKEWIETAHSAGPVLQLAEAWNAAVVAAAAADPNMHVIDWDAASNADMTLVTDGVHPSASGKAWFAAPSNT